jgi:hypothetical protein
MSASEESAADLDDLQLLRDAWVPNFKEVFAKVRVQT